MITLLEPPTIPLSFHSKGSERIIRPRPLRMASSFLLRVSTIMTSDLEGRHFTVLGKAKLKATRLQYYDELRPQGPQPKIGVLLPERTDGRQVTEPPHRPFNVSFGEYFRRGGWDKEKSYDNPNRLKNGRVGGSMEEEDEHVRPLRSHNGPALCRLASV